jgi:hypothetical protein
MDHKAIMRACVILRGVVRYDPTITGLELAVGHEAVLVTSVAVDGSKRCELIMGPDAAAKYLARPGGFGPSPRRRS